MAYDVHDRIRISSTMAAAQTDLVERLLEARDSGALMLAVNRRDVDELNALARTKLLEGGMLGDEVLRTEERSFALSDEVVCLRNAKKLGVLNGTRGTVVGFDADGLHIETSAGPRVLPTRYVEAGHLTHGYATTVHKAQGATYDRAFVLATDSLTREAGYVAMSRARSGTELFVISGAFEDGRGPDMGEDEPLARTAARLATSQAKSMASEHLVGGLPTARHRHSNFPSDFPMGPSAGSPSAAQVETAPAAVSRSSIDLRARFADIESPEHHVAALGPVLPPSTGSVAMTGSPATSTPSASASTSTDVILSGHGPSRRSPASLMTRSSTRSRTTKRCRGANSTGNPLVSKPETSGVRRS